MGKRLIEQILPSLVKASWPTTAQATALGRKTYEIGLDQVDAYRGDAKQIAAALRTFLGGDSRPYAFAGVAYALLAIAREGDGSYDPGGVQVAQSWLEKAQSDEPDLLEINFIEALVYVYSGRLDDARLVLDYLWEIDPAFYYLNAVEVAYWVARKDLAQIVRWCEKASQEAVTNPQRLQWWRIVADSYFAFNQYEQAIPAYKQALQVDPQNGELWYQTAFIHWRMGKDEDAERANQQALRFQPDYQPAQDLAAAIAEKKKKQSGRLGGLFSR